MEWLRSLFSSDPFMPHGYCYLWQPGLIWLHLISDSLIALAYLSIPVTLVYFVRKRRDVTFHWMFLCFGTFIVACGATHAMEVWTLWHATYWLSGAVKALAALVSVGTAALLVQLVPSVLALPHPEELRKANLELKHQAAALREQVALLELTHDSIIVRDTRDAIQYWNHGAEQQYGWARAEALGKFSHAFLRTDSPKPLREVEADLLRDGQWEGELAHRTKDGRRIVVRSRQVLRRDAAGTPVGVLEINNDITVRKQAEEVLRQSEAMLQQGLEQKVRERTGELEAATTLLQAKLEQQAVVADLGRLALVESSLQRLLDKAVARVASVLGNEYCGVLELLPEENVLLLRAGVGWKEGVVGHERDSAGPDSQSGYTLQAGKPVIVQDLRQETRFSASVNLHEHAVVSGMSVVIPGAQHPYGVLGTHTARRMEYEDEDVHFLEAVAHLLGEAIERHRSEKETRALNAHLEQRVRERTAELEASNNDLEAFTYSVAHDLRSPLRHIDGFSKILLEDFSAQLDGDARHHLERVRQATVHMGHLVDDLLNLSRIARRELTLQITGLNQLVESVLVDLREETAGREIEWKIGELPFVECDSGLMKLVFVNLLSNAIKYTRPRAHAVIEVGQAAQDGQTVLFVRDNGVGFHMKYADKLFGVFQRLHRQEDFEGTGIGLASVERIIHKHGGRVWAEAELDKGATFYFTIGMPQASASAPHGRENARWQPTK